MSKPAKIILGIVITVTVLCMVGLAVSFIGILKIGQIAGTAITTNPAKIESIAERIAEFKVPEGYTKNLAMQLGEYYLVSYIGEDENSEIILAMMPQVISIEKKDFEAFFSQSTEELNPPKGNQVTGYTMVTIRGQDVKLEISEGINSSGKPYKSVSGLFRGKHGTVLLSINMPLESWDQDKIDAFIDSIQ